MVSVRIIECGFASIFQIPDNIRGIITHELAGQYFNEKNSGCGEIRLRRRLKAKAKANFK